MLFACSFFDEFCRYFQAGLANSSYGFGATKNDENAFSRAQQKTAFSIPTTAQQSFSIHVDPEPVLASAQSTAFSSSAVPELNPALTSLSRPALTNVFVANRTAAEGKCGNHNVEQ